jgi:hypothetical protein
MALVGRIETLKPAKNNDHFLFLFKNHNKQKKEANLAKEERMR